MNWAAGLPAPLQLTGIEIHSLTWPKMC